jgi:SAM-dependent methyltransferase
MISVTSQRQKRLLSDYWQTARYMVSGRRPWSKGYESYRRLYLTRVLRDEIFLSHFLDRITLPAGHGLGMDERVVEYPWVISRLKSRQGSIMDAGGALNKRFVLDLPWVKERSVLVFKLSAGRKSDKKNLLHRSGDLRHTGFPDDFFDVIVCISTLEHIGMDNTLLYTHDTAYDENKPLDYLKVIDEFHRILKPKGTLLITVPYGRYKNHGWFQQFDMERVDSVVKQFKPARSESTYFKYTKKGWQVASSAECADCSYYDVHKESGRNVSFALASESVACLEMVK